MASPVRLEELQERLRLFSEDREWSQFHTLSNLASSISVEAAELVELFLWAPPVDEAQVLQDRRADVEAELADVAIQCLNFAEVAGIDLLAAVARKIDENARKYPVEASKGRADKYVDL